LLSPKLSFILNIICLGFKTKMITKMKNEYAIEKFGRGIFL